MVKLADTLAPMSDFPVAKAEHITVKIKDKEQNLETTLNSMSGGYTVEELPEASAELFGKVYQYIGETTDTLTKGYFYVCTTDENAEYIWEQTEVQKPGLPDPDAKDKVLVSTENEETSELEWSQVDKGTIDGSAYVNLDVGSDLNTLITHGRFRTTTKRVDRIENVPVQVAGMLTVRLTGSVIYQTYNSIDNKMYTRTSEDAGENWSDWKDVSVGDSAFKGTHDEWDALTDEQKAMFETVIFTDDYANAVEEYSTEEVKTNKVWIDGKPIYRLSGISTTSTLTSKINKTIIDNMIRSDVHVHTPGFIYGAMSYVQTSSNRSCYEINKDGALLLSTGSLSFNKIVFTFEYTKTTD